MFGEGFAAMVEPLGLHARDCGCLVKDLRLCGGTRSARARLWMFGEGFAAMVEPLGLHARDCGCLVKDLRLWWSH